MATQSAPRSYVNVVPSQVNGELTVDLRNAPIGPPVHHGYINIDYQEEEEEGRKPPPEKTASNDSLHGASVDGGGSSNGKAGVPTPLNPQPSTSVDIPAAVERSSSFSSSSSPGVKHASLEPRCSEPCFDTGRPRRTVSNTSEQAVVDAKLKLLLSPQGQRQSGGRGGMEDGGCENCKQLSQLLAMWEIGVSGLTRNYSRILAHLIKIRNASVALEFRLENAAKLSQLQDAAPPPQGLLPQHSPAKRPIPKNRRSMFVDNNGPGASPGRDIAEFMYPEHRETPASTSASPSAAVYTEDLADLNSHLVEAIDLCQQLAAACFKTNHLSELKRTTSNSSSSSSAHVEPASSATRKHSAEALLPAGNAYKPSLQSITESRTTKRKKLGTLERVPSAPNLELSCERSSCSSQGDSESSYVNISMPAESSPPIRQSHDRTTNVGVEGEGGRVELAQEEATKDLIRNLDSDVSGDYRVNEEDLSVGTFNGDVSGALLPGVGVALDGETGRSYRPVSVISSASTYSDTDVKCVMTKIAQLEEERYKLLETINSLQEDNTVVSVCVCPCIDTIHGTFMCQLLDSAG